MVEQYLVTSWIIFLWLLALQVKVVKVASFVSNIVHHENHKYVTHPPPPEITSYMYMYTEHTLLRRPNLLMYMIFLNGPFCGWSIIIVMILY